MKQKDAAKTFNVEIVSVCNRVNRYKDHGEQSLESRRGLAEMLTMVSVGYISTLATAIDARPGTLAICGKVPGDTDPPIDWEPFAKLFHIIHANGQLVVSQVSRLEDLAGVVQISSPISALDLVRIDSTPKTADLLETKANWFEIIDRSKPPENLGFGDANAAAKIVQWQNGARGVIDHEVYQRFRLPSVSVDRVGTSFVVRRPVMALRHPGKTDFFVARQLVARTGQVRIIDKQPIAGEIERAANWSWLPPR